MKTIQEIYTQYHIPPALQMHMFRVAAVAEMIMDHWEQFIDREAVVTALLLHDMGNIIKFNLDSLPELLEPQGKEYWQSIQDDFVQRYGNNEEVAHVAIVQELGVSENIVRLVAGIGFRTMCHSVADDNLAQKICNYADLRVYPHGVVSLAERLEDGRRRYNIPVGDERWDLVVCAKQLEEQIFQHCDIVPEDINDIAIAPYVAKYSEFHL
jgi:hypothetical protein